MSNVHHVNGYSPELQLLAVMIERDHALGEADREAKQAARSDMRAAMEEEIEARRDGADATRTGAVLEGGMTVVGSGLSMSDDTKTQRWGGVTSQLARPVGNFFGKAEAEDAERAAREAAHRQEEASWRADDAAKHEAKVDEHSAAVIEQMQGIIETQDQTTLAVLSNF